MVLFLLCTELPRNPIRRQFPSKNRFKLTICLDKTLLVISGGGPGGQGGPLPEPAEGRFQAIRQEGLTFSPQSCILN
jgi:hypothetical protein